MRYADFFSSWAFFTTYFLHFQIFVVFDFLTNFNHSSYSKKFKVIKKIKYNTIY
jgi:hypothetical protein